MEGTWHAGKRVGRDEGVMEGWWEYREKEERGTTVGREEEEQYVRFWFYSHPWVSEEADTC